MGGGGTGTSLPELAVRISSPGGFGAGGGDGGFGISYFFFPVLVIGLGGNGTSRPSWALAVPAGGFAMDAGGRGTCWPRVIFTMTELGGTGTTLPKLWVWLFGFFIC